MYIVQPYTLYIAMYCQYQRAEVRKATIVAGFGVHVALCLTHAGH